MQISSRFTVAVHILVCIEAFGEQYKTTSDFIAGSVNVNPVVIRRILQQLKAAGLVNVARGSGGAKTAKPLEEITFYDIYMAVECVDSEEGLFRFHEDPNTECPVGRNIHSALDSRLFRVQQAMENEMKQITLADVVKDTRRLIEKESNVQSS